MYPTQIRNAKLSELVSRIVQCAAALVDDASRNEMIVNDIVHAIKSGRCPLLLTGRTEHLHYFRGQACRCRRTCLRPKRRYGKEAAPRNRGSPGGSAGKRIASDSGNWKLHSEGFDDARLDTLFLAMPISWKGTLQQYVGRLHRLHDNKRFVQVYDYLDNYVVMLARMYERRLKGLCRDWSFDRAGPGSACWSNGSIGWDDLGCPEFLPWYSAENIAIGRVLVSKNLGFKMLQFATC